MMWAAETWRRAWIESEREREDHPEPKRWQKPEIYNDIEWFLFNYGEAKLREIRDEKR